MIEVLQPLNFLVKKQNYIVRIPTAGDLWDIEAQKAILSEGKYGLVVSNKSPWSDYALDNLDMFAYLKVLVPNLIDDLKVDSWKDLSVFDLEELKEAYNTQLWPWFVKFTDMLKKVRNKETEGSNDESTKSE